METQGGFRARLEEMTDTLQQRKQLLEAEKQLQRSRRTTLQEINAKIEQIHRLTSAMRNKANSVSLEIGRLEKVRDAGHAQLEDILHRSILLAAEIIQLQQEHEQTSPFYERNKEQMELCRKNFEEQNLSLRDEIKDLEKESDELNRSEDARKKQLLELDESILEEEEKGRMLASMKEKVIREIASNSIKEEKMEAVLEKAVKESDKKREELEALVLERRRQLIPLQEQNKYWENQIYKHMHARTRMQKELEVLENRAAQASRALYG